MRRLAIRIFTAAAIVLVLGGVATAAELVMFESDACSWCETWHEEIGYVYDRTDEGRRLPLRRVDIHERRPSDLAHIKGVYLTPTFVVMADGREFGRIRGYPGEWAFYGLLNELIAKLDRPPS